MQLNVLLASCHLKGKKKKRRELVVLGYLIIKLISLSISVFVWQDNYYRINYDLNNYVFIYHFDLGIRENLRWFWLIKKVMVVFRSK